MRVVIADPVMLRYAEGEIGEEVEVHDDLGRIALAEGWATEPGRSRKKPARPKARTARSKPGGSSAGARSEGTRKGRRGSGG